MMSSRAIRILLTSILMLALGASVAAAASVTFRFENAANQVFLAGEFNGWSPNAQPMSKGDDGIWTVTLELDPGDYQYKYVADGNWITDPHSVDTADDIHLPIELGNRSRSISVWNICSCSPRIRCRIVNL